MRGVFVGVLGCIVLLEAVVLGCLRCWGIKVQVYQDNRVLGCLGYRVLRFGGVEVAGIWGYWGWILEFGGAGILRCQSFGGVWVPGFGVPVFQWREAEVLGGQGLVVLRFEGVEV